MSRETVLRFRKSITRLPFCPPSEKLPYECPPDLACTFTPAATAHKMESETCCAVVGSVTAAGVYLRRRLYGSISEAQLEDELEIVGTFLLERRACRL